MTKFTGKHLCQSLFFNKVACLACNFIKKEILAKVFSCKLRIPFSQNTSGSCCCSFNIILLGYFQVHVRLVQLGSLKVYYITQNLFKKGTAFLLENSINLNYKTIRIFKRYLFKTLDYFSYNSPAIYPISACLTRSYI